MGNELARTDHNLERVLSAIEGDHDLQPSTKDKYTRAVLNYAETGGSLTDPEALARYAAGASDSQRAFLSAAVGKLAKAIEHEAKRGATPENVAAVQATVYRAEALRGAIATKQANGTKAHTWLSQRQVKELLDACGDDILGQRDRLALGLLVAAGLRRLEAVNLRFEDVKLQPNGEKIRTVLQIHGKGAKDRVVPISDGLANAIDRWAGTLGESEGRILRSLGRDRKPGDSITTTALYYMVQKRGAMIGKPDLQPHDLRRTYAQLGYEAGIPITQISTLLGHASVETTQRYLNLDLDLETTVSDFIPF